MSKFNATINNVFHISVGGIVLNDEGKVLMQYWSENNLRKDMYLTMRKSLKDNETLEDCLKRGLLEEMGVTGEIVKYIGSQIVSEEWFGELGKSRVVEKLTIYFQVKLININESLRVKDINEPLSELVWLDLEDAIEKSIDQFNRIKLQSLNESDIFKRLI